MTSADSALPVWIFVLLILLTSGNARVETRLAAGFNRRNRSLQGAAPLWSAKLPSAAQCLSACIKLGCQSLTFGRGQCQLFPTFLCHPQDRFHLSLVPTPGVTYFDLSSGLLEISNLWRQEGCLVYGRCLEKCHEGSWTTSPPPDTSDHSSINGSMDPGDFDSIWSPASGGNSPHATSGANAANGASGANAANAVSGANAANAASGANSHHATSGANSAHAALGANSPDEAHNKPGGEGTSSSDIPAPPEEIEANLLLMQQPSTFDEALSECQRRKMSLAMPENQEEHDILVEAMKKRKIARMWIGVKKITASGKGATYVDGRPVPNDLLLWGEDQPNNSRGGQICVEMIASLKYLWNDFDCLFKSAFVCR